MFFSFQQLKGPTPQCGAFVHWFNKKKQMVAARVYALIAYAYIFGVAPKLERRNMRQTKSTLLPKKTYWYTEHATRCERVHLHRVHQGIVLCVLSAICATSLWSVHA